MVIVQSKTQVNWSKGEEVLDGSEGGRGGHLSVGPRAVNYLDVEGDGAVGVDELDTVLAVVRGREECGKGK